MSRRITTLAIVAGFVFFLIASSAASNKYGVADRRTVEFSQPVQIGDKVFPAGVYDVRHTMEGNEHVMVFTLTGTKQKATARARCTLISQERPVEQNQIGFTYNERGERVLVRLQFKGDTAVHRFRD